MNLRYVVPALGLVALSASAASAQEIAKGVTLDGFVDTIFTATTNDTDEDTTPGGNVLSTTDFTSEGVLMVGWSPIDRVSAKIVARGGGEGGDLNVVEAWGSVTATDQLVISGGQSYGPFGYYAPYATGLFTVNNALSTALYTVNPFGVWADYSPNDKVTITVIVADEYYAPVGKSKPAVLAPGLDIVFKPNTEWSFDLEGWFDPSASPAEVDANGNGTNDVWLVAFNAQYKMDRLTAAGEVEYQVVENNGETLGEDDQKNIAWAAFASYALPVESIPMAATVQLSQLMTDETGATDDVTSSKAQVALLTNPLGISQFGLNFELFAQNDDTGGDNDDVNTFGASVEGLFVIP